MVTTGEWKSLSCVWLFVTPWTVQSMEFSRPESGVGSHPLIQGIFPTQGSNPGHLHCRQILYQLSHHGSPRTGVGSLSLLQWIFLTQELNQVSCIAGRFFTHWAIREALICEVLEGWAIYCIGWLLLMTISLGVLLLWIAYFFSASIYLWQCPSRVFAFVSQSRGIPILRPIFMLISQLVRPKPCVLLNI